MAVRFLPLPGEDERPEPEDRGDLAEVISLRSRLSRSEPAEVPGEVETPGEVGAPGGAEAPGETGVPEEGEASEDAEVPEGPERSASEDGVRLLARRARSSGELRAELLARGHDADEVEDTLDEFVRSLYLDDLGLARVLTEKLRDAKRASRAQIRRKLKERRLPDEAIETAIGELDETEEGELLRDAAEDRARKLAGLDRQTAERRLLGFLSRRGWGGEPAMRAAREALDAVQGGRGGRGGVRFR